jgi:hypothetical protein
LGLDIFTIARMLAVRYWENAEKAHQALDEDYSSEMPERSRLTLGFQGKRLFHLVTYNTHGHKLRFPPSEKVQFVTECGIENLETDD